MCKSRENCENSFAVFLTVGLTVTLKVLLLTLLLKKIGKLEVYIYSGGHIITTLF